MKQFIKKFLIIYVITSLIFLSNFNTAFAKQYEKIYLFSLSLQSIISSFLENIKSILPGVKSDEYKEKYFNLLKELAQIKIAEQEKIFLKSLELIKSKYPNSTEVKKISSGFGIIYAEFSKNVKEGSLVVDENWILIGKVRKVLNNYLEIISLNYPGLQFNVANLDGKLIGLANTTGLGYIEVNFTEPDFKIKTGDLLITAGNDEVFPKGFLIGEVVKVEQKPNFQKLIISPLGNFDSNKFIVIQ